MRLRVLVCGGRDYSDQDRVFRELDLLDPYLVIMGGALGADHAAGEWAALHGVPCMRFDAPWAGLGKGAGAARNGWMLEFGEPDLVLAFPGGRGTANMLDQAYLAGIPVQRVI